MSKIYYYDFLKQNVLKPKFAEEQKSKAEKSRKRKSIPKKHKQKAPFPVFQ